MTQLPTLLTGRELDAFEARRQLFVESGQVPEELATRVAVLHPAYQLLYVIEIADREGLDPVEVARVHFQLGERLGLPMLVGKILALPRDDRWQTMARAALRDDVYAVHAQLTAAGAAGDRRGRPGARADRRAGRRATRWSWPGRPRRSRTSAPTRPATSPASRSGSG